MVDETVRTAMGKPQASPGPPSALGNVCPSERSRFGSDFSGDTSAPAAVNPPGTDRFGGVPGMSTSSMGKGLAPGEEGAASTAVARGAGGALLRLM